MILETDFWTSKKYQFNKIFFCRCHPLRVREVLFETNLSNVSETVNFFRTISKFVMKKENRYSDEVWFQFFVSYDGELEPIKWFTLKISDRVSIDHDVAFDTVLLKKNNVIVPLGRFPFRYKKRLPIDREYKIERNAYKYIANQIQAELNSNKQRIK